MHVSYNEYILAESAKKNQGLLLNSYFVVLLVFIEWCESCNSLWLQNSCPRDWLFRDQTY